MKDHRSEFFKTVGLQFFADKGGEGEPEGDPTKTKAEGQEGNPEGDQGKTFTQEEVNRLLSKEKEKAQKGLLKELGVENVKSAKDGLAKYKEILDKDKTDAQKAQEDLAGETKAKQEAESRAAVAEAKVAVLTAGCKAEYLEDVMALAMNRVTDDKDLETVVSEMKKDDKYAIFFGESDPGNSGTGGGSGYHRRKESGKAGSLGARLGAQANSQRTTQNPYFKN